MTDKLTTVEINQIRNMIRDEFESDRNINNNNLPGDLTIISDADLKKIEPCYLYKYNFSALKLIIKKGYPVNKQSSKGFTLLHYYAQEYRKSSLYAIEFLLENGADKTIKTNTGLTALDIATFFNKKYMTLLT